MQNQISIGNAFLMLITSGFKKIVYTAFFWDVCFFFLYIFLYQYLFSSFCSTVIAQTCQTLMSKPPTAKAERNCALSHFDGARSGGGRGGWGWAVWAGGYRCSHWLAQRSPFVAARLRFVLSLPRMPTVRSALSVAHCNASLVLHCACCFCCSSVSCDLCAAAHKLH